MKHGPVSTGEDAFADFAHFAAGGTLAPQQGADSLGGRARVWRIVEFAILFFGAPVAMRIAVHDHGIPLFYALPPVLMGFIMFLLLDPTFSLVRELQRGGLNASLISILSIFAVGCIAVGLFVALAMPDRLFALAAERPGKWLKIMTLYPLTSVLPQEIVYRVFFFHRYGPLFRSRGVLILTNALVFSFGHILFRNWIAVAGTFAAGVLFAWRYERTRSFWAVYVEHVLWGWLVFTIGLGVFFFTGVKNPAW